MPTGEHHGVCAKSAEESSERRRKVKVGLQRRGAPKRSASSWADKTGRPGAVGCINSRVFAAIKGCLMRQVLLRWRGGAGCNAPGRHRQVHAGALRQPAFIESVGPHRARMQRGRRPWLLANGKTRGGHGVANVVGNGIYQGAGRVGTSVYGT